MTNLTKRVLLIFIVIPILFAAIGLLTFCHHIIVHIFGIAFMTVGSMELWKILTGKEPKSNPLVFIIPALISLVTYLECADIIKEGSLLVTVAALIFIVFAYPIFTRDEKNFEAINKNIQALTILILYPGFFFSYAPRLTDLPYPGWSLVGFLVLVFMSDIFAYVFGMAFGKSNRNIFPVSPKKSLMGFIGGFFATIFGAVVIFCMGAPIFGGKISNAILVSAIIGIVAPVGDLIESAMKRSAKTKDSANYIPGRGGVLDNIDSIIFSAPVFYYLIKYICLA